MSGISNVNNEKGNATSLEESTAATNPRISSNTQGTSHTSLDDREINLTTEQWELVRLNSRGRSLSDPMC